MVQQPAEEQVPQGYRLRIDWRVADGYPISFANQFMVQMGSEEFVLTLAQLAPPALVEPTREEIESLSKSISPQVVSRVAVTPEKLRQLIRILQQQLTLYDSGVRGVSDTPPDITGDSQEE